LFLPYLKSKEQQSCPVFFLKKRKVLPIVKCKNHAKNNRPIFIRSSSPFVRLINHQPAVIFSQNKPGTSNQPAVLFYQNKSASAISHQPNEHVAGFVLHFVSGVGFCVVKWSQPALNRAKHLD
jgi:hypothetical protein